MLSAQLGLMGMTILYSSGDYGVAGNGDLCLEANGTQAVGAPNFNPSFPGTCPYITSVGATQVVSGATVRNVAPLSLSLTGSHQCRLPRYTSQRVPVKRSSIPGVASQTFSQCRRIRRPRLRLTLLITHHLIHAPCTIHLELRADFLTFLPMGGWL